MVKDSSGALSSPWAPPEYGLGHRVPYWFSLSSLVMVEDEPQEASRVLCSTQEGDSFTSLRREIMNDRRRLTFWRTRGETHLPIWSAEGQPDRLLELLHALINANNKGEPLYYVGAVASGEHQFIFRRESVVVAVALRARHDELTHLFTAHPVSEPLAKADVLLLYEDFGRTHVAGRRWAARNSLDAAVGADFPDWFAIVAKQMSPDDPAGALRVFSTSVISSKSPSYCGQCAPCLSF